DPREDPLVSLQWHLSNLGTTRASVAVYDINVDDAWNDYSGKGLLIGIIDSGVDETHPDLIANYRHDLAWNLPTNEPGGAPHDDDPYVDHGTAVAGLIPAAANGIGVVGFAYASQFVMYRRDFPKPSEAGQYSLAAQTMLADGVDITNNSLGAGDPFYYRAGQAGVHASSRELATLGREGLGIITVFVVGRVRVEGNDAIYHPLII